MRIDHVGIQTTTAEDTVRFAETVLGGRHSWSLERFSATTRERVPGIVSLTEVEIGEARLHVMQVQELSSPEHSSSALQHVCFSASTLDELSVIRARYEDARTTGPFSETGLPPATNIETDDRGVSSFYFIDPNGIEFEITHMPDVMS